jgi:UPF0755 protein
MKKILTVLVLIIIFIGGFFLWWKNGNSPVNPKDKSQKVFVIPKGTAVREIGNSLKKEGLIRDPVVFFLYIKQNGLDKDVQAGSYKLSPSMDLKTVMDTLRHGTVDVWVTIPEGFRAAQIAEVLKDSVPSYNPSWDEKLEAEEGYLFPDTYLIPKDADINEVISIFTNNFYQKIGTIGLDNKTPNLNTLIIKASLIEREAKFTQDRPNVASVIDNRLSLGMPLQIDATVQYALGYSKAQKKWWPVPMGADLKIDSSYNTYINTGLPPAPICNPGLSAIKAAHDPAATNYIYYVNDKTGKLHFAETKSQHDSNIEKYLN